MRRRTLLACAKTFHTHAKNETADVFSADPCSVSNPGNAGKILADSNREMLVYWHCLVKILSEEQPKIRLQFHS